MVCWQMVCWQMVELLYWYDFLVKTFVAEFIAFGLLEKLSLASCC